MKKNILILAATIAGLYGCNSGSSSNNTVTPQTPFIRFIPNWYDGDTLYATKIDAMGHVTGVDMIITKTSGDTSMISYHGSTYYIFQYKAAPLTDNEPHPQMLGSLCISTNTDTSGTVINLNYMTVASPYKYLDQSGQFQHQTQSIVMGDRVFFPTVSFNTYTSNTVH